MEARVRIPNNDNGIGHKAWKNFRTGNNVFFSHVCSVDVGGRK